MKNFFLFSALLLASTTIFSQGLFISGQCVDAPYTLPNAGTYDGRPYYEGQGSVGGSAATIDIIWSAADAQWQVLFDGQPYYYNTCNVPDAPYTSSTTCTWVPVTGQTCTGPDPLVIGPATTLPVRMLNFSAVLKGDRVLLEWRTASETNSKSFSVQRSADGRNWSGIGLVRAAGTTSNETSYLFIDSFPLAGNNSYRLLQTDIDGRITTTNSVRIVYAVRSFQYNISNNPGGGLYVINLQTLQPVQVSVTDINGRHILDRTLDGGRQVIDITKCTAGTYLLRFSQAGQVVTEKLIKR